MLEAKICITLKKTVADPQGLTIKHALEALSYKDIANVRVGKFIIVALNNNDKKNAAEEVDGMCKSLLANPIIEDYSYTIEEV